jgi:hypothetical protein
MTLKDSILKHMEVTESAGAITVRNTNGWYSAKLTVSYKFEGKPFSQCVTDITLGVAKSINYPGGSTEIIVHCEEFWGFGWSTIFNLTFDQPVTKCYNIWGTTLDPHYEETKC